MAMDIKICGLSTAETIERASARGATHVGFIHFPKSPRHLSLDAMAALRPLVPPGVKLVVVTVDADDATLGAIAARVRPDMLQLHGHETPERLAEVKRRTGLPAMKALSVGSAADLDAVAAYRPVADAILLDAKRPKGSELPGGNGVSFDWRLLAALDPATRYMLSGGLHAGNVAEALALVSPAGIDVSSGVESAPGVKDVALIEAFFDALDGAPPIQERKAS
ncbi:phosphoribosylanthranilate isomerase [Aureimonas leprariae]|uniref:N-(5'-phosphoribosyl)anthranilate isomerase n=1 Tax=Plantimonas leprariae TaxID=2615207 RepID=A0A7V7PTL1_9HYPH|nr:phosphoribosylanthranilate isomerase [Aureimonas leprariae]KAB0682904.1 phosphoribosylanthranilate isomerase [Aureimonas leprariae]